MIPKRSAFRLCAALLSLVALAAACGGDGDEENGASPTGQASPAASGTPAGSGTPGFSTPDSSGNLFGNGGFEDGRGPWYSLKPPDFALSTDKAHSGDASAHLELRAGEGSLETDIRYLVQEISPEEWPEFISGNYFVENWKKNTKNQYLQFVVIVFNPDNLPECPDGKKCPNYQIRYLLAGIDEDPFPILNAKFVYLSKEAPKEGEWVPFQRDLREDFLNAWGAVPRNFEKIRVLFEVRYDAKLSNEGPLEADVYYDDLHIGAKQ